MSILSGDAAYLPVPADEPAVADLLRTGLGAGLPIDERCALVVSTSGSTGVPKGAMHSAATLRASIDATDAAFGGPGSWLLALPPHHIAGLQVLLRSLAGGYEPVVLDVSGGFDPVTLPAAIAAMNGPRRYTSLVPLQIRKALGHPAAVEALGSLDAVLVGGAATPPELEAAARAAGLPIVLTYGMSETAGGCVYDGIPLPGTEIRIEHPDDDGVGRVLLHAGSVALGYRNLPDHPAFAEPGWFRTDDLGAVDGGVLRIVGRADEAIGTGGLTVLPQVVEAVIRTVDGVVDCAVFGVPDERLGHAVTAAVVLSPDDAHRAPADHSLSLSNGIQETVARQLDRYAVPRRIHVVDALPTRGPGKVDRRALAERFSERR